MIARAGARKEETKNLSFVLCFEERGLFFAKYISKCVFFNKCFLNKCYCDLLRGTVR